MEGRPRESLVLFDPPHEVPSALNQSQDSFKKSFSTGKKSTLPPLDNKPKSEDILNALLPPREWSEQGKRFIQYVSH